MDSTTEQFAVFAEETHAGRGWAILMLIAVIAPAVAIMLVPRTPVWPMPLLALVGLGTFAVAWNGFQYRFSSEGLEIRMLGFRLRSIPKAATLGYSIEGWNLLRGYGIRMMGSTRAYVWCDKVVHINTSNGQIFIGHNDPARIVRDLDQMMGFVARG